MKVIVFFTDGTNQSYECLRVIYEREVAFLKTSEDRKICIPYRNVYVIQEFDG